MSSIAKDLKTYKLQLNDGDNLIGVLKDFSMAEEGAVPLSQKLENTTIENLAKVASMAVLHPKSHSSAVLLLKPSFQQNWHRFGRLWSSLLHVRRSTRRLQS